LEQYFRVYLSTEDGPQAGALASVVEEPNRGDLSDSSDLSTDVSRSEELDSAPQPTSNNLNIVKPKPIRLSQSQDANLNFSYGRDKCEGKKPILGSKKKLNTEVENKFKGADEPDLPPTFRWVHVEIEKE
jgi:hypothetical protein